MNDKKEAKVLSVRGTAKIDRETGDVNFVACKPGEPVQRNVKKRGSSSFYETEGKGQSSLIAHLKVDKDSPDPAAKMFEELNYFTKDIQKSEPKAPKTYMLLDKEGVKVSHRPTENVVTIHLTINLDGESELSAKLFNLTSEVSKCFAINRKRLTPTT